MSNDKHPYEIAGEAYRATYVARCSRCRALEEEIGELKALLVEALSRRAEKEKLPAGLELAQIDLDTE